jgi:hypothetical protein
MITITSARCGLKNSMSRSFSGPDVNRPMHNHCRTMEVGCGWVDRRSLDLGVVQFLTDRDEGVRCNETSAACHAFGHVLHVCMTCSMKLGLRVPCFHLKLVYLGRSHRHQFESAFVSVEPAPFL